MKRCEEKSNQITIRQNKKKNRTRENLLQTNFHKTDQTSDKKTDDPVHAQLVMFS